MVRVYYDDPKQHKIYIFTSSNEDGVTASSGPVAATVTVAKEAGVSNFALSLRG